MASLDIQIAEIHQAVQHNTDKLDEIKELLTGNGDPAKGMIVRLDRVERGQKWLYGILAAVFAPSTLVGIVWYFLT